MHRVVVIVRINCVEHAKTIRMQYMCTVETCKSNCLPFFLKVPLGEAVEPVCFYSVRNCKHNTCAELHKVLVIHVVSVTY